MRAATRPLLFLLLLLFLNLFIHLSEAKTVLDTAGSSFATPLYNDLGKIFTADRSHNYNLDFTSLNSNKGVQQLLEKRRHIAMTERRYISNDFICVPAAVGGIAIIYNLDVQPDDSSDAAENARRSQRLGSLTAVSGLSFSVNTVLGIFNGTITYWNHTSIAADNPSLPVSVLPSTPILPVHRTDKCGTTFAFTSMLSKYSQEWKDKYGVFESRTLWPADKPNVLITDSNEAMLKNVAQTKDALGYVSLATLSDERLKEYADKVGIVNIYNFEAKAITPSRDSLKAAAEQSKSKTLNYGNTTLARFSEDDFSVAMSPGLDSYPLATYTWMCTDRVFTANMSEYAIAINRFLEFLYYRVDNQDLYGFAAVPKELQDFTLNELDSRLLCIGQEEQFLCLSLPGNPVIYIIIAVIFSLLMILIFGVIIILAGFFTYRKYARNARENKGAGAIALKEALLDPSVRVTLAEKPIGVEDLVLEQQIGSGSFAEVYRGKWLGTTVAIKRFLINAGEQNPMEDFMKETTLMSSLRHPNIVQYLGATVHHPHLYLMTEFCEKGNLQSIIRDKKVKLSVRKQIKFVLDAAKGMLYLHSATPPIIHRDLKSANLLVDKNWTVKVGDFGMSRVMDSSKSMTVCGTAETCAPEVLSRNQYTEKADVFSFGIVLWEVLSREPIHPGLNFYELSSRVVNEGLRPPTKGFGFAPEIEELMTSCWNQDANMRPTFKHIVHVLETYHEKLQKERSARKKSGSTKGTSSSQYYSQLDEYDDE